MNIQSIIDRNINKDNIKPVLLMILALCFFPFGFYFTYYHYKFKGVIALIMTMSLLATGLVFIGNDFNIVGVVWKLNILSFSFVIAYLTPVLNKKMAYIKTIIFRLFIMLIYLVPFSIIPLYLMYGDINEGFEVNNNFTVYFSYGDLIIVTIATVSFFFCAAYSFFDFNINKKR